ncbi:hypothetical protein BJ165DRAFT_1428760 [Panaeolus papilionaceus]|nr:hypothetical protein BJ165DRAFT_1428760 [Panaeolus papilionaceus]
MASTISPIDDVPTSPDTDNDPTTTVSEISTPITHSGRTSPAVIDTENPTEVSTPAPKKKKKKKPKKSGKSATTAKTKVQEVQEAEPRPSVLCISRNKHWRYISSYHGPWLQLPLELLDQLLTLNLDPNTLTGQNTAPQPPPPPFISSSFNRPRDRMFQLLGDHTPPDSPRTTYSALPLPPPIPPPKPGKATPPPIDPGVFRSVRNIRHLIDEAAELSVRASSGLSAVELGSMRSGSGFGGSPWATAQSLGLNPLGNQGGNGRNVAMSAMRIHRLRALAVQKLAQAYKTDEIASSVMVMQGGSVFDDVAERVLKTDPNDADAKYVHFFHEKIPSRQLAESTTTKVLDELIAAHPQHLEYYRTRGIVHCFREEFSMATKDFTFALKEARAVRRANIAHRHSTTQGDGRAQKNAKRRNGRSSAHTNGQAPPDGTSTMGSSREGSEGEPILRHPSTTEDAPEPIEPQLLFLRGAAYLQHAIHLIENAVLNTEGISRSSSSDAGELRLSHLENAKYGNVEMGNPDGLLRSMKGAKLQAYSTVLGEKSFRDQITQLVKKSLRDQEKFLAHFDSLESASGMPAGDLALQTEYAFLLTEAMRPGNHNSTPPMMADAPATFTTYHPLLVESHFTLLICQLMLADFSNLVPTFVHAAMIIDGLEGYPIFLPPRSMSQAEFVEVLERLASGWKTGTLPHSLTARRGKSRLAIEAPPTFPASLQSSPIERSNSYHEATLGSGSSRGSSFGMTAGSSSSIVRDDESTTTVDKSLCIPLPQRPDAEEALDFARILLAPVVKRQKERAAKAAAEKTATGSKKKQPINIPLHGPRVEVILAWLAAVHLPELDMV